MTDEDRLAIQRQIARELGVTERFDAEQEIERRVTFLADYLRRTGLKTYVLGISGGVDSLTAGCLAQRAVERIRQSGGDARFIAVRLPYHVQADEEDAEAAVQTIEPDAAYVIDIKPATDGLYRALMAAEIGFRDMHHEDVAVGNIKARQRMVAQYAIAAAYDGLVIGTDHAAEALMGFFTKYGDGAADVVPLTGLNKRRVRALAARLGAPERLVCKVPTADLEALKPLRPDEDAFGVTYEEIDDFLECKPVSERAFDIILRTYRATAHKRALPVAP